MPKKRTFTICIPTYNSEKTLKYTLDSIKKQTIPRDEYVAYIIDGGSTDKTLEIAKQYHFVEIIPNPHRLPEYAKSIAIQRANSKYIVFMDSDEAFSSNKALAMRRNACMLNSDVHLVVADKLNYVKGYGVCGTYVNKCGDPFTWFIYKQKNGILQTFEKNISSGIINKYCVLAFSENDKRPIADGGTTTVDLDFIRKTWPEKMDDVQFACSVGDMILSKTGKCICIRNDNVLHRSRSDIKSYMKKIKFRVVNNVFARNESGFSTRKISKRKKKYLFPLYTLSITFPIIDGIRLSVRYKTPTMLLHPLLCLYTLWCIGSCFVLKLLNKEIKNERY